MRIVYEPKTFSPAHEAIIRQADEIASDYAEQGYDLTLRQLYYQFVARDLIPNTVQAYKRLGSIVNDARLAGRLDWLHLVDRTRNLADLAHWDDPAAIVDAISRQFRIAKWDRQPHRVEVWIEKEALAGVIQRVARRLDVPYIACRGYMSQSEQWTAGQRIRAHLLAGQSVTILHLGDHDPSGIDMSRDNEKRLRGFISSDFVAEHDDLFPGDSYRIGEAFDRLAETYNGARFYFKRIALNFDQVEEYDPPPNPAKLTDSRADGYVAVHGYESWELDALEPSVLDALVTSEVEALRDDDLWEDAVEEEDRHRELLALASDRWHDVVALLEADQ